jgi:hypothetical protein
MDDGDQPASCSNNSNKNISNKTSKKKTKKFSKEYVVPQRVKICLN